MDVFYHRSERDFNVVVGRTRRRRRYEADRGRQFIIDAMRQLPEQKKLTERGLITWHDFHRVVYAGYSRCFADGS